MIVTSGGWYYRNILAIQFHRMLILLSVEFSGQKIKSKKKRKGYYFEAPISVFIILPLEIARKNVYIGELVVVVAGDTKRNS